MLRRSRDAKQHLALRVAHLNAAILVEVLNQESGPRQPIWRVFEFHSVSSAVEAAGVRQIASASDSRSAPR
jgi:hypothetical protein